MRVLGHALTLAVPPVTLPAVAQEELAAAGNPDIEEELLEGVSAIGRHNKAHLDGCNALPLFRPD